MRFFSLPSSLSREEWDAGPEEVEEAVVAAEVFDGFFDDGDGFERDAKALEEVDPELVLLALFVGGVFFTRVSVRVLYFSAA